MVTQAIYAQIPIQLHGTIPVFSEPNEYTNNYEKISAEHLDSLRQHGTNPFIPEEMWIQYEDSTADLIRKYTKTGDKILDVGVGLGRLLSRFPNLQRYGMDISFGYLEVAQSKGIEVCYALVEDMPYHQETFDLVVCTDILEHVLDLNQSIAKILMVLKPEGFLIVRVPYREDLSWYLSRECSYKYVHLRNFDEHSLHLLFEKIFGCKIIEVVGDKGYPTISAPQTSPLLNWKRYWRFMDFRNGLNRFCLGCLFNFRLKAQQKPVPCIAIYRVFIDDIHIT